MSCNHLIGVDDYGDGGWYPIYQEGQTALTPDDHRDIIRWFAYCALCGEAIERPECTSRPLSAAATAPANG